MTSFKKRFSLFGQSGYEAYVSGNNGQVSPSAMDENMMKGYMFSTSPVDGIYNNSTSPAPAAPGLASRHASRGPSPQPNQPRDHFDTDMSRDDLHKNLRNLENVMSALDEYRDLAFKLTKASKKYSKALRDYSGNKECEKVYSMTISGASGYFDAFTDVQGKLARALQRDYDTLNNFADKHFRKIAKEERTHDDFVGGLDKQIKKAGGKYEQKARKKDRDAAEAHERYISTLSQMGSEIARAKRQHQISYARRERYATMMVAQCASRITESAFSALGQHIRKCGPYMTKVQEWAPYVEENMPPPPPDLRDSDEDEETPDFPKTPQLEPRPLVSVTPNGSQRQLRVVNQNEGELVDKNDKDMHKIAADNTLITMVESKEEKHSTTVFRRTPMPTMPLMPQSPIHDAEILDPEKQYWSDKTEGSSSSSTDMSEIKNLAVAAAAAAPAPGPPHERKVDKVSFNTDSTVGYNTIPQLGAQKQRLHDSVSFATPQQITSRPLRRVSVDVHERIQQHQYEQQKADLKKGVVRRASIESIQSVGSTVASLRDRFAKLTEATSRPTTTTSLSSSNGTVAPGPTNQSIINPGRISALASHYDQKSSRESSIVSSAYRREESESKRLPKPPDSMISHSKYCTCERCRNARHSIIFESPDRDPNGSLTKYERSVNVVSPRPIRFVDFQKL